MLDMKVMKTIFMRGGLHKKGLHTAGINGINKLEQRQMENNSFAKYPEMDSTKNWNILGILYSFFSCIMSFYTTILLVPTGALIVVMHKY